MAVPRKRAKVLPGVARGEQRRWLLGSSSDGAGIRVCVGSSEEDPFDLRYFLNCIDFLFYTFKTFVLQHQLHP